MDTEERDARAITRHYQSALGADKDEREAARLLRKLEAATEPQVGAPAEAIERQRNRRAELIMEGVGEINRRRAEPGDDR